MPTYDDDDSQDDDPIQSDEDNQAPDDDDVQDTDTPDDDSDPVPDEDNEDTDPNLSAEDGDWAEGHDGATDEADFTGSADEYPQAQAEDFEDDTGDWSVQDYNDTAQALFSDHPNFGETAQDAFEAQGFELHPDNEGWLNTVSGLVPGAASTMDFFVRDGQVVPQGFVTMAALAVLANSLTGVDLSHLHITLPGYEGGGRTEPQPLPPQIASVKVADKVDLRPYCTPVEDQKQTMRCSAFAWTHAVELAHQVSGNAIPPLSPSFTMLEFQRMQGDFKDYRTAWKGGDGTEAGPRPGECVVQQGTCRQELWPNDSPEPRADENTMAADARRYALDAQIQPIHIDDVKQVLSSGCPVHVAMTTGPKFGDLGRDGVLDAAEEPSGDHGWHAMLVVGYVGNYYIIKNSWGTEWGDKGYFYAPKKVLVDAQAEFNALLPQSGTTGASPVPTQGEARSAGSQGGMAPTGTSPTVPVIDWSLQPAPPVLPPALGTILCRHCQTQVPPGKFCMRCGQALEKFCPHCGTRLAADARFCMQCGQALGARVSTPPTGS